MNHSVMQRLYTWRNLGTFLLLVLAVLLVQILGGWAAHQFFRVETAKLGEAIMASLTSAMTLLTSTWVAFKVTQAYRLQDQDMQRKANVMKFHLEHSTPDYAAARRSATALMRGRPQDLPFKAWYGGLAEADKRALGTLMLLFRQLQMGLEGQYFDRQMVVDVFGDDIVIWQDIWFGPALKDTGWSTEAAMATLRQFVDKHASAEQMAHWRAQAQEEKDRGKIIKAEPDML